MTNDEPALAPQLEVHADLRLVVDGVTAQISGAGGMVRVRTDDTAALTAAVFDARRAVPGASRSNVVALTRALDDAGVTIELVGDTGTVATVGHGQRARLGALVPGLPYVRSGPVRVAAPVAWDALRRSTVWPRVRLGAAVSISVVGALGMLAVRRSRSG